MQASCQSTVTCSLLSRPIAVAMDKRPRRRRDDDESFLRFWNDGKPVPSGRSGDEDASKENVAPAAGAGNGAASASREAERVERPHSWRRLRSRVSVPYRPLRVGRPPLQASVDNPAAAAAATGPSVKEVHTPEHRSTPFRRPGAPLPARIRSAVRRAVRRQRLVSESHQGRRLSFFRVGAQDEVDALAQRLEGLTLEERPRESDFDLQEEFMANLRLTEEQPCFQVREGFLQLRQDEITADRRRDFVDWMVTFHQLFDFVDDVLFYAIDLLDRFLEVSLCGRLMVIYDFTLSS